MFSLKTAPRLVENSTIAQANLLAMIMAATGRSWWLNLVDLYFDHLNLNIEHHGTCLSMSELCLAELLNLVIFDSYV